MERPLTLYDRVEERDRFLECRSCGVAGVPEFSESGKHIKATCRACGAFIRFARQILPPEERAYWDSLKKKRTS